MDSMEYTLAEQIADVSVSRPHVVILGAGASRAALPNGDRFGRRLPVMNDIVNLLGLEDLLISAGVDPTRNFEELYSELSESTDRTQRDVLSSINARVDEYFSSLQLPDEPTIYDALVLSLRKKDLIATFNWDPLLWQAMVRNHSVAELPHVAYLHGNVAIGFCAKDHRKGFRGTACPECRQQYTPSRLLYPVTRKGYRTDEYISAEWDLLQRAMQDACILTFFGYGAPASDVEAVDLLRAGWGNVETRELEQTEIVDIRPEDDLLQTWDSFIHTHHHDVVSDFYESWQARFPRRTCEVWFQQFIEAKLVTENRIPLFHTLPELQSWFRPLIEAENG